MSIQVKNRAAEFGNTLIIAAMCLFWIVPMVRFWGAVFGPLRPYSYSVENVAPPWISFMIVTVACFVPVLFPVRYYTCWERGRGIRSYKTLGVQRFKQFATNGDFINRWARRSDDGYRLVKDTASAQMWIDRIRVGEQSHLVLFLMGLASAVYAAHIGWTGWAVGLALGNILFNGYPVLLQRYNRCRIERLLARLTAVKSGGIQWK